MGKTAPFLETFTAACGSASIIFKIIDRNSKIDSMSNRGKTIEGSVQGNISFKNVCFSYPSRSDVQVCYHHMSVTIKYGHQIQDLL